MKDQGIQETRSKILLAAVRVWSEDYSAPLKRVAKEAGVSRMTLHRYFCGRDAILVALVELFVAQISQFLIKAQAEFKSPVQQMEFLVKQTHRLMEDYNFLFDVFEQKGCPDSMHQLFESWEMAFEAFFETLEAQGLIQPNVPFAWANSLLLGLLKASFNMKQKQQEHLMDLSEEIWRVYRFSIFKADVQ